MTHAHPAALVPAASLLALLVAAAGCGVPGGLEQGVVNDDGDLAELAVTTEIAGDLVIDLPAGAVIDSPVLARVDGAILVVNAARAVRFPALERAGSVQLPGAVDELALLPAGTLEALLIGDFRGAALASLPAITDRLSVSGASLTSLEVPPAARLRIVDTSIATITAREGVDGLRALTIVDAPSLRHLGPLLYAPLTSLELDGVPALSECEVSYLAAQTPGADVGYPVNPDFDVDEPCQPIEEGFPCDHTFGLGYICADGLACGDPASPACGDGPDNTPCTGVCFTLDDDA